MSRHSTAARWDRRTPGRHARGSGGAGSDDRRPTLLDPFRMERRRERREAAWGVLCASYTNGVDKMGITHLELLDRSSGGLGARTRTRIEPGANVTICPEGSTVPWLAARAVRCEALRDGFRVGLKYIGPAAA